VSGGVKGRHLMSDTSYHGNPNLKPIGHSHKFTPDQIQEIIKCTNDPIYFIETYCQIVSLDAGLVPFKLYGYQKKVVKFMLGERMGIVMMPRQQGKTITAAACILWYTLFQDAKTVAIMANKGAAAREVLSRYQLMYENLPIWMQQGVKTWNKGDVELENGSRVFTAATVSSGIRGKSVNWLYIDEAAIIPNNVADEFFASVYPTISSGKTTKILLTSTPLGYNHFWKFWNESVNKKNAFSHLQIHYWEHPGRDEAWAEEQRKILGDVKFNQEVLCEFLGSSNTLISGAVLGRLSSVEPVYRSETGLDVYEEPKKGRIYVLTADTARGVGGDYSAFTVVDVTETPYKLVAKYKNNHIAPMLFPNFIFKVARDYNNAYVLVETNDIGGQVADILHMDLEYEQILCTVQENGKTIISAGFGKATTLGVRTTKSVKRQGCFAIKSLVEENKLLCFDADTIMEFSTFIEKNGTYVADEGYHDDLVMTLVLFAWLTTNPYFRDLTDIDIREKIYHQQMTQIEEELTPFGIIDDGSEPDEIIVEKTEVWSTDGRLPWRRND
jgi:hypothetical protein